MDCRVDTVDASARSFLFHLTTCGLHTARTQQTWYYLKQSRSDIFATRMHCNLRQPDAAQSLSALIRRPCHVWSRSAYRCRLRAYLLLIRYVTLWPWTLTPWPWPLNIDLEPSQCIVCDLMKLCAKFERKRTIHGGVIAVWIFDLMTLNMYHVLRYALGKFKLSQAIRSWNMTTFSR